jgi:exonuclease SbcD
VKSFRFIHTGDIHLDSPLKGLSGQDGAAAERIRTATRVAFDNLVTRAVDENVSFVIIAGDLYDGDWRDYQTGLFFVKQMGRLAKAEIPVFLLYGNHDAESQITRRLLLPDNVRVFSSRKAETFRDDDYEVALHGQSFRQRDVSENLVPAYPDPVAGFFNIGVLHTGLGGMSGHANYAPCTIDDLVNKGYDYWALAHIHQAAVLHEKPHVIFCGNLQGRHIRETGEKAASLVTVEDGLVEDIQPIHVDVVRWSHIDLPVVDCAQIADVIDLVHAAVEKAVSNTEGDRMIACRVELSGTSHLHGRLLASTDQLVAEARSAALTLGEDAAWIERVIISTRPPIDPAVLAIQKDAMVDLHQMIAQASGDKGLLDQLATEFGDLIRKLPHDVRTEADDAVLKAAIEGDYAAVIEQISGSLMAQIASESS